MKYTRKNFYITAAAFILLCIAGFSTYVLLPPSLQSDEALAREEVFLCRGSVGEEKKEICYQKNVPQLMDQGLSMERAFTVLMRVLTLDPGYQSCHVLAHLLASREVAKDPSKWKDVIVRAPMAICGSGALHGAFQERFSVESLPNATAATLGPMLDGVCDARPGWNPTFLDRSSCMHGMGHLFVYVTNADVKKSVALCDALAKRPDFDFRQTCFEGVFMQLYQPLEPEDKTLIHAIEPALEHPQTFCAQFTGMAHNACVKESWPDVPGSASDPKVFEALCDQLSEPGAIQYCASGLMYPVIEVLHYDVPTVEAFCGGLKDQDLRNICWARTASKFVWADWRNVPEALSICVAAPTASKDACWKELMTYAYEGMPKDSPQAKALCGGMPDPYKGECTNETTTR